MNKPKPIPIPMTHEEFQEEIKNTLAALPDELFGDIWEYYADFVAMSMQEALDIYWKYKQGRP